MLWCWRVGDGLEGGCGCVVVYRLVNLGYIVGLGANSGNGLGGASKHKQDNGLVVVVGSSPLCSLFFVGGGRTGVLCQTLNLHYSGRGTLSKSPEKAVSMQSWIDSWS